MPDAMQYGFLAWLRADVQLAHAEAFGWLVSIPASALAAHPEEPAKGSKK